MQDVLDMVVHSRVLQSAHLRMLVLLLVVSRIADAELVVFRKVDVGGNAIVVNWSAVAPYCHTSVYVMLFAVGESVNSRLVGSMV